jgi:hypothetical protein
LKTLFRPAVVLTMVFPVLFDLLAFFSIGFGGAAWASGGALFEVDSGQVASNLENYFQQADEAVAKHQIRLARQQLSLIGFKIEKYSALIGKNEKKTYTSRLSALTTSVKRIIDSLVQVNLVILRKNGPAAGIEFRQKCASEGLSETELAPVDEAIVNVSSSNEAPQAQIPAAETQPTQVEQTQVPAAEPQPTPRQPEISEIVPKKDSTMLPPQAVPAPAAPAPPPSPPAPVIKTVPEAPPAGPDTSVKAPEPTFAEIDRGKKMATSTAAKVLGLVSDGKNEDAMTIFNIYQANMRQFLPPAQFEQLKSAVNNAYIQDQNRLRRAQQVAQTIDDLVEDRVAEAFALFQEKREELEKNIGKDEFDKLGKKVGRAYVEFGKAQGAANVRAREIRALVSNQQIEKASTAFEQSRVELQRCLSKDAFEALRLEVTRAVDALRDKKKQCLVCVRDIRSLIKEGNGVAAYSRFMENRPLLEQHLDEKSFASLASDVGQAKSDFFARQAKAQAELTRIDSLIACKRIESAWDRFKQSKDALRRDFADDKRYFDLKDRVGRAYDDFSDSKKRALKSERRILSLVKDHQGRDAYMSFMLDAGLLGEYLEPGRFKKLENEARCANADYESKAAAARRAAMDIEGLLIKKQIEEAYSAFKKAEQSFDRYLDDGASIDALKKKVREAYSEFRKRQKWSVSLIRHVRWLIDHAKGNQAYTQFHKARNELALFIDAKQIASLDTATAAANRRYLAAKALAEQNAKRVGLLLDQKRFEDAYRQFKDLRGALEEYLSETSFNNLRNEVTNAYDEWKEKKKRAEDYAKQLKFLVSKNKTQEAYSVFQANRASLKQYLTAKDFSKLEKMMAARPAFGPR